MSLKNASLKNDKEHMFQTIKNQASKLKTLKPQASLFPCNNALKLNETLNDFMNAAHISKVINNIRINEE